MEQTFNATQRLAYHIAKNYVSDAFEVLRIYRKSFNRERFESTLKDAAEKNISEIEEEMRAIAGSGVQMVFHGEPGYPKALLDLPDAPVMLFVKSATPAEDLFNGRELAAVVGTRDIDAYGIRETKRVIEKFASAEPAPVIVSGLAVGVDEKAHNEAMDRGLGTIAVLPSWFVTVYPSIHQRLADTISQKKGCGLVTPFAPGTEPAAVNFLLRNRVIAGLCGSTTVVESKARGGAMVTARIAHSYGRRVYAVPGHTDDVRSKGCNALIREGIAEMCLL